MTKTPCVTPESVYGADAISFLYLPIDTVHGALTDGDLTALENWLAARSYVIRSGSSLLEKKDR